MRWLIAILLGLTLGCLSAASNVPKPYVPVGIPQLQEKEVKYYLKIADELSRYRRPWIRKPIVLLVPEDQFIAMACGFRGMLFDHCPLLGFFRPDMPHLIFIRMSDEMTYQRRQEVLIHEMVHWLQHDSGWKSDFSNCRESALHEIEAYQVSYLYIILFHGADENFRLPPLDCVTKE